MKDIAKDMQTSVSGVSRCLALYPQGKPLALPRVLSFDKFKGNANGERFQWILTAPEERHILDILPDRRGFRHPILPAFLLQPTGRAICGDGYEPGIP